MIEVKVYHKTEGGTLTMSSKLVYCCTNAAILIFNGVTIDVLVMFQTMVCTYMHVSCI